MRIAIIGSGISGLTAAYCLHKNHDIRVFESTPLIGGHTATKQVEVESRVYAIDTGFIVFNDWTYPNFIRLLDQLGVESEPTLMGFSVSARDGDYEYSGDSFNTLFSQRRNLFRRKHWQMLYDILRFNRSAIADLESGRIDAHALLGDYLRQNHYSRQFIDYYLVPMGCAIWSASTDEMLNFPLLFFVRFFKNHGLLSVNDRPQWRVIKGGSSAYLERLTAGFSDRIQTQAALASVRREDKGVSLIMKDGTSTRFDQVILACHSDQALDLLEQPTAAEQSVLKAIAYHPNQVVLHTDTRLLPVNKRAWSSWNYRLETLHQSSATLTYHMNTLQNIQSSTNFCVTLNATEKIDPSKILGEYVYSHPVFTHKAMLAQARRSEINGVNRTWFCGAYWANGFHEDGCLSGLEVARALGGDL